jgi:hypothetical protein
MIVSGLLFEDSLISLDERLQLFGLWQGDEIAGDEKLLIESGGGVLHLRAVAVGAKDEAYGRIIIRLHHRVFPKIEIVIHLSRITVLEGADFQID